VNTNVMFLLGAMVMRIQSLMVNAVMMTMPLTVYVLSIAPESENENNPQVVRAIPPKYPYIARAARVSGEVVAEAIVDPNGEVISVSIIKGHKLLNSAVEKSASQWKFSSLERGSGSRKVRLIFQFTLIPTNKGTPDDLGVVFWPPYKVEVKDTPYRVD
jgi:TonB family protein